MAETHFIKVGTEAKWKWKDNRKSVLINVAWKLYKFQTYLVSFSSNYKCVLHHK